MKAIVQERYGPPGEVLELRDVDRPAVDDDGVLVRVRATSVAGDDWHLVRGLPYVARLDVGLLRPKHSVPGQDVAGRVEAVGSDVTRFRPGDEVFGWAAGAWAEHVATAEATLAHKPTNLTFAEAAAVPISGLTALQGVRDKGAIQSGHRVLVNGAAGGVGTLAVQVARSFGAHVTGVCSTGNVELVRSLGADRVVDYTREDFTASDERYDLILDMVGNRSLAECRRALRPEGTLVLVGGRGGPWFMGTDRWLKALVLSPFVGQRLRPLVHTKTQADLLALKALAEAGKVSPVVGREVSLDDVPEAIRSFEDWHASGKVVIAV